VENKNFFVVDLKVAECDSLHSFHMRRLKSILLLFFLGAGIAGAAQPAFGDLAVLAAKGFFRSYVSQDASLAECVAFLSQRGVGFSLFDIMDSSKTVTKEDLARVIGQSVLLFSGEAELLNGSVKKPAEAETWVDYCLLNDIDFEPAWDGLVLRTAEGHLPEVREFFGE